MKSTELRGFAQRNGCKIALGDVGCGPSALGQPGSRRSALAMGEGYRSLGSGDASLCVG